MEKKTKKRETERIKWALSMNNVVGGRRRRALSMNNVVGEGGLV